jgi:hypothetical protein
MFSVEVITNTYYTLDSIPYVKYLPCGDTYYNKIHHCLTLDDLNYTIQILINEVKFSIKKYDSIYEPEHKEMVESLKNLLDYLNEVDSKLIQIKVA